MKSYPILATNSELQSILDKMLELKSLFGDWPAIVKHFELFEKDSDFESDLYYGICGLTGLDDLNFSTMKYMSETFMDKKGFTWSHVFPVGDEVEYYETSEEEKFSNPVRLEYIEHCIACLTNIIENNLTTVEV